MPTYSSGLVPALDVFLQFGGEYSFLEYRVFVLFALLQIVVKQYLHAREEYDDCYEVADCGATHEEVDDGEAV